MRLSRIAPLLVLASLASAFSSAQVNPKNMDLSPNPRGSDFGNSFPSAGPGVPTVHRELYQLWEDLPGIYETSDPKLRPVRLILQAVSPMNLFLEARTTAGGKEILERGYVGLGDASPGYRSTKMRFSLVYRPETLGGDFCCSFFGAPAGAGVRFETEGSDCSFPLRRPVSQWRIEASANGIVVTDVKTGEATLLKRVARAQKS